MYVTIYNQYAGARQVFYNVGAEILSSIHYIFLLLF